MKSEKHVLPPAAEWYVISEDGRSALRLCHGLRIGESDAGVLSINDPAAEDDCVGIDFSDRLVPVLRLLREDRLMLLECGQRVERYQLSYGVTVQLPHNALHIGRDIGGVERTGAVVRIVEPEPAVKPVVEPAVTPAVEQAVAPAVEPAVRPVTSRPDGKRRSARRRRGSLAGASLSAAVLAAAVAYLAQVPDLDLQGATAWFRLPSPADARETAPRPTVTRALPRSAGPKDSAPAPAAMAGQNGVAPVPGSAASAPAAAAAEAATAEPAVAEAEVSATEVSETEGMGTSVLQAPVAEPPAVVRGGDPRLVRARQLLRRGDLTLPPGDNAVAMLSELLAENPEDEAALDLLSAAIAALLAEARQAHEQGRDYEARNLLEEALVLRSDDQRAARLWREWVGTER